MKKVLIGSMIALSLAFSNNVSACGVQFEKGININDIKIQSAKIADIIYQDGWYYAITELDSLNGYWVLDLSYGKNFSEKKMKEYKEKFVGKMVEVQYVSDFELLSWYFLDWELNNFFDGV